MTLPAQLEDERRQFRTLVRHFAYRFVDHESLAAEGDLAQTAIHLVALLAALGFLIGCAIAIEYFFAPPQFSWEERRLLAGPFQQFLVSLTMAVTGLVTVFIWDSLFPDRRDCLGITSLPVRTRTVFCSKVAAVALAPAVAGFAVNAFPAMALPMLLLPDNAALLTVARTLAAYIVAMAAAGAFVFFTLLGLQGLLVCVLGYRVFQRVSSYAQIVAFLVILAAFFLIPSVRHPRALAAPENQVLAESIPLFWFVALYETLLGSGDWLLGTGDPELRAIAVRAVWGLAASGLFACVTYGIGYARHVRKVIEQSDFIAGRSAGRESVWRRLLDRALLRGPREQAVFHFIVRSLYRSRQHRLLLALYCGIGLGSMLSALGRLIRPGDAARWLRPSGELLLVPLVLAFFVLVGMRVAFTVPLELRANWIFQLTDDGDAAPCLAATRKALFLLGLAPVVLAAAPAYLVLWSPAEAWRHILFVTVAALILIEILMLRLQKIPFTCSFLPGKANLKVMFGVYWALFTAVSASVRALELWSLRDAARYGAVMAGAVAVLLILMRRRAASRGFRLIYEEQPEPVVRALELRP